MIKTDFKKYVKFFMNFSKDADEFTSPTPNVLGKYIRTKCRTLR